MARPITNHFDAKKAINIRVGVFFFDKMIAPVFSTVRGPLPPGKANFGAGFWESDGCHQ